VLPNVRAKLRPTALCFCPVQAAGPALDGQRDMPLALRLSEGLGRNGGQVLSIDAILDFMLTHVEKDKTEVFVIVFSVKA